MRELSAKLRPSFIRVCRNVRPTHKKAQLERLRTSENLRFHEEDDAVPFISADEARARSLAREQAWQQALAQPDTVHLGERLTHQQVVQLARDWSWESPEGYRRHQADGFARIRRCRGCEYWYVAARRYEHAGRVWALRCAACKAATQARRARTTNVGRTRQRGATRTGRCCATCQAPLTLARRTKRFCSDRCRLAAWRNAKGRRYVSVGPSDTVPTGSEARPSSNGNGRRGVSFSPSDSVHPSVSLPLPFTAPIEENSDDAP